MKTLKTITVSIVLVICFQTSLFAQHTVHYDYLIGCFKNPEVDSMKIQVSGNEDDIKAVSIGSSEVPIELGLVYYTVPEKIRNKSSSKLADIAVNRHIETWKRNSSLIKKQKYVVDGANIIDLRLHMLIENIYLQIVVVNDGDRMYELMHFEDTYDQPKFDQVINKVLAKGCFN